MWLAGCAVRVVLLIAAPIYFLCRFLSAWMSKLDEWSWHAIHARNFKKPPQSETAPEQAQESANRAVR